MSTSMWQDPRSLILEQHHNVRRWQYHSHRRSYTQPPWCNKLLAEFRVQHHIGGNRVGKLSRVSESDQLDGSYQFPIGGSAKLEAPGRWHGESGAALDCPINTGAVNLESDGTGSSLNVSSVTSFTDNGGSAFSRLQQSNGGVINDSSLTAPHECPTSTWPGPRS